MNDLIEQSILYDIYGVLLDEKQRLVYEYHVIDDLSFNEIGEELNLSRQAVYDLFKRANKKLNDFESKLFLSKRLKDIEVFGMEILNTCKDIHIKSLSKKIISLTKMEDKYGGKNSFKKIRANT